MNTRERIKAILNYEKSDKLPALHFGYWYETLAKWAEEGHISMDVAMSWGESKEADAELNKIIGWDQDFGYAANLCDMNLRPVFDSEVLAEFEDDSKHVRGYDGVVLLQKPEAGSIPAEIEHILVDRKSWEQHYLPRLQFTEDRYINNQGMIDYINADRDFYFSIVAGSIYGTIRNWIGVVGTSYMLADDPDLLKEIIDTFADLQYKCVEKTLAITSNFDGASMWEDICFNYGPLINPKIFAQWCGPHYKKLTDLLAKYGITRVHLDCDGLIDELVPIWVENGVNIMFPIEVGTWGGSLSNFRQKLGKKVKGVGGMDKKVFALDYKAVDKEIERLRPIIEMGGYIPCPDHRIAPDAKFDNVKYYVEKIKEIF